MGWKLCYTGCLHSNSIARTARRENVLLRGLGVAAFAFVVTAANPFAQAPSLQSAVESLIAVNSKQPAKIYVEGGPKELKNAVLALLRQESVLTPVPYVKQPEANIKILKDGRAEVKCGKVKAILPGPTPDLLVKQFKELLPGPLRQRRLDRLDPRTVVAVAALHAGDYATVAQMLESSVRQPPASSSTIQSNRRA